MWLHDLKEVWSFDEDELVSNGIVELIDEEGMVNAVPVDLGAPQTLAPPVTVRLYVAPGTADVARLRVEHVVRDIGDLTRRSVTTRYDEQIDRDVIELWLWPSGEAADNFERLVDGGTDSGWVRKVDNGWFCDFWWSNAETTSPFLTEEIQEAAVSLNPWDNPVPREIGPGRTPDAGLPT